MGSKNPKSAGNRGALYSGLRPVRTLCMLSIVAHHARWTEGEVTEPLLGVSFGLNTLQVILCALIARGPREPELRPFVRRRARRLLTPWLGWSGVYIAAKIAQSLRYGHAWNDQLDGSMWLHGGSFHLWFLLYGFAASLLALAATRVCRGDRALPGALAAAGIGATLLLLAKVSRTSVQPTAPLDLWLDGLPAVAFGVAIGRALSLSDRRRRAGLLLLIAALSLVPLLAGAWVAPESQLWARYAVAVPLACAGFALRFPDLPLLTWLAERNMGVYVVHILALQVVDRISSLATSGDAVRIAAVYAVSLGMVVATGFPQRLLARLRGGAPKEPPTG